MEVEISQLKAMQNTYIIEYEMVNKNIKLPEGFDEEWKKKLADANDQIRQNIREMGNMIQRIENEDETAILQLPTFMKKLHDGFSYYYELINNQEFIDMVRKDIADNPDLEED